MPRNLLIIYGHPVRDAFSENLLSQYCHGAETAGASIRQLKIRELDFELNLKGGYRHDQDLEPDLQKAQEHILWAEHIVFIFPNWWATFPALFKGFIDRTFSYLKPDYLTHSIPSRLQGGKKLVFIQTQALPDETQFADVFPRYEYFFKWYGFDDIRSVRACGVTEPGEVRERKDAMDLAAETARNLMEGGA